MNAVLSPVCRAVLLIGIEVMQEPERVLLVLTGDSGALLSGAPSFSGIPKSSILAHRGDNVVEVSLYTAIRYLRLLDAAGEKVNDVLRQTTEARKSGVTPILHEEATNRVRRIRDDKDWTCLCDLDAKTALDKVMARATE